MGGARNPTEASSPTDRPRERLDRLGTGALSTVELLTLVIGSGGPARPAESIARDVAAAYPDLRDLARRSIAELTRVPGVGPVTGGRLAAAFEIGRRLARERRRGHPLVASPRAVWRHLSLELRDRERERFLALYLNARNEIVREELVSIGSLNASIVHPREVFKPAVVHAAAGIVVAHNHPSGDPAPSREDREVTRVLAEAGRLLDIPLYDHVIVGSDSYYSFKDAGLL